MFTFNTDRAELLFNCFLFYIFYYSLFTVLIEFSIFFCIVPILLYLVVSAVSLNLPEETSIDSVLGLDPRFRLRNAANSNDFMDSTVESYFSIAYRSAPFDSTKNTLNAVLQCARNGCKVIHVEVKFTSDNVAMITRDTTVLLKRDDILIEKSIEECTFDEIKQNSTRDSLVEITQEMIPTLEEVVAVCRASNVKLIVHVVHSSYYRSLDQITLTILDLYEKNGYLYESCLISCNNPLLLYKIRRRNTNIVTALNWSGFSKSSASSVSWLKNNTYVNQLHSRTIDLVDTCFMWIVKSFVYRIIGSSVVILPKDHITSSVVEFWEKRKVRCVAAVVNLPVEKMYYKNALAISYLTETVISADMCTLTGTLYGFASAT